MSDTDLDLVLRKVSTLYADAPETKRRVVRVILENKINPEEIKSLKRLSEIDDDMFKEVIEQKAGVSDENNDEPNKSPLLEKISIAYQDFPAAKGELLRMVSSPDCEEKKFRQLESLISYRDELFREVANAILEKDSGKETKDATTEQRQSRVRSQTLGAIPREKKRPTPAAPPKRDECPPLIQRVKQTLISHLVVIMRRMYDADSEGGQLSAIERLLTSERINRGQLEWLAAISNHGDESILREAVTSLLNQDDSERQKFCMKMPQEHKELDSSDKKLKWSRRSDNATKFKDMITNIFTKKENVEGFITYEDSSLCTTDGAQAYPVSYEGPQPDPCEWKDDVLAMLKKVLRDEEYSDDLARIIWLLSYEDRNYADNILQPYCPYWKTLKTALDNEKAFKDLALRLSADTRRAEVDPLYKKAMYDTYRNMINEGDEQVNFEVYQGTTFSRALVACKDIMPLVLPAITTNGRYALLTADGVLGASGSVIANTAVAGLTLTYLSFKATIAIRKWWKGEITGARCCKILIDETISVGAGLGLGVCGTMLGGMVAGPVGAFAGGMAASMAGAAGAASLSDWLTQKVFALPKDEAVENAFRHLGVLPTAANSDVNKAFHRLCLEHHPDKGGDKDKFIELNANMQIIREARGEFMGQI